MGKAWDELGEHGGRGPTEGKMRRWAEWGPVGGTGGKVGRDGAWEREVGVGLVVWAGRYMGDWAGHVEPVGRTDGQG